MNTWPFWKCIKDESREQFIQYVLDKLGIDLIKEDKKPASVTYSGKLEDTEQIAKIMSQVPASRKVLGD